MWCVAKVGMHDFLPKVDLVREFWLYRAKTSDLAETAA